jgi:hypothetical protein
MRGSITDTHRSRGGPTVPNFRRAYGSRRFATAIKILLSGDLQSMMRVVKTSIPNCRFLSKPVDTKALLSAITELSGSQGAGTGRSADPIRT